MKLELGKGHVDLLLLAVLETGPAHGYGVIATLRERSDGAFDLAEGTVYPTLHRLEAARLVKSSADSVQGRTRRVYRLTERGRRALSAGRQEWENTVGSVRAVLAVSR